MSIKVCSKCNVEPKIQPCEIEMVYRLVCTECGKHTNDVVSRESTLENPCVGEETLSRLVSEWNDMN